MSHMLSLSIDLNAICCLILLYGHFDLAERSEYFLHHWVKKTIKQHDVKPSAHPCEGLFEFIISDINALPSLLY